MGERHAGQGYMTEALGLMLGFAFGRLRLHRVEAACLPHNGPSRAVLGKTVSAKKATPGISLHRRALAGPCARLLHDEWPRV